MHSGEPKDHEVCAQDDKAGFDGVPQSGAAAAQVHVDQLTSLMSRWK